MAMPGGNVALALQRLASERSLELNYQPVLTDTASRIVLGKRDRCCSL